MSREIGNRSSALLSLKWLTAPSGAVEGQIKAIDGFRQTTILNRGSHRANARNWSFGNFDPMFRVPPKQRFSTPGVRPRPLGTS